MIVCDLCEGKTPAIEATVSIDGCFENANFPIRMHLCCDHAIQLNAAVQTVVSVMRAYKAIPDDEKCRELIDRFVPWKFDEKGSRVPRTEAVKK